MDYIDRIIAVRVDADDTQRSLGKALDINYVQWANYERRFNEMPIRYLIKKRIKMKRTVSCRFYITGNLLTNPTPVVTKRLNHLKIFRSGRNPLA